MARQVDLEPIEVSLGEEFQPFLGMKKLRPGESINIIGQSRMFDLREIGQGTVVLENNLFFCGFDIKGNFLSIPNKKPQIVPVTRHLKQNFPSALTVDIDHFLSPFKPQPDIRCIVRCGELQLIADNINLEEDTKEGALFYRFTQLGKSKPGNLLVPPKLSFLKDLYFRFESK